MDSNASTTSKDGKTIEGCSNQIAVPSSCGTVSGRCTPLGVNEIAGTRVNKVKATP